MQKAFSDDGQDTIASKGGSDMLVQMGSITGAHGIRGDVIVKSFTDPKENLLSLALMDLSLIHI
jgi:hypothetical protein